MTDTVNVPREPTSEMIAAACGDREEHPVMKYLTPEERGGAAILPLAYWRAMLAAAPKAEPVEADDFGDALLAFLFRHGLKVALDVSEIEALRQSAIRAQPEAPKVEQEPVANPLVFGLGALVVDHGKYGGEPAVFVAKAKAAGRVGELTGRDYFDRESLQPGELVLQFPTDTQAKSVADALVGSPAPVSDELLEGIAKDAAERVHKNGGCVPYLAYAPILFALQDALATEKKS